MYYRLQNCCRLVKGASRGAIYNFQNGKVYSINPNSVKLLEACANHPLEQVLNVHSTEENPPLDFLQKLTQMGLGSVYLKEPINTIQHPEPSEPVKLSFLWLELTSNCNNKCLHCYATSGPCLNNDCVPHERWLSLISEARQEGATDIQLIGGEPLLYPGWRDLVIKASAEGFNFIEIFTNAILIDDSCIDFFHQYKVNVATTILGSTAEVHDKVSLHPGSYDKTMGAIQKLKAENIPLRIASIIMKANEHDAQNIIKLGESLGYDTTPDVVRPTGRGDDLDLLPEVYRKRKILPPFFTDEYEFTRAQSYHNCLGGKIAVTSTGDVIPCIFAREKICGNILTTSLSEVLQAHLLQYCWHTTKDIVDKCQDCEYRYACYDCRPLAQGSDPGKRWLTCSPGCAYNPYTGEWEAESSLPVTEMS